jgi:hypothetical protein
MVARLLSLNSTSGSVANQSVMAGSTFVATERPSVNAVAEPARVGLSLIEQGWRPFAPQIEDDSSALARLAKLAAMPEDARLSAIDKELSRLVPISVPQHRYQAAALLLRDLTQMGWLVCVDRGQIYIRPHEAREPGGQPPKEAIRRQHLDDIYLDDLGMDQFGEDQTTALLVHLRRIEEESRAEREVKLIALEGKRQAGDDDSDEEDDVRPVKVSDISKIDLVAAAKRPLFRIKRARAARELVQALAALKHAKGTLPEVLGDPKAEWAVAQALRQLKKAS